MRLNIYTVFDSASGVYDRPFFAQSDGQAVRSFGDICVNEDHPIGQHPADYTLFRIGTYDDNKAAIIGENPERLVNGVEMVAKAQKVDEVHLQLADDIKVGGTA